MEYHTSNVHARGNGNATDVSCNNVVGRYAIFIDDEVSQYFKNFKLEDPLVPENLICRPGKFRIIDLIENYSRTDNREYRMYNTGNVIPQPNTSLLAKSQHNINYQLCSEGIQKFSETFPATLPRDFGSTMSGRECNVRFTDSTNLQNHSHSQTIREIKCVVCQKEFSQSYHLRRHMLIHTGDRPFMCNICKMDFAQSSHLKRHMHSHTSEKTFFCTICNRSFSQSYHLKQHMIRHDRERKCACKICNQKISQLLDSEQILPSASEEKCFNCTYCNRQFCTDSYLKEHVSLEHFQKKGLQCHTCNKVFWGVKKLRRHQLKHRPASKGTVSCKCGKKFTETSSLQRHVLKVHSGDKPVKCKICDKEFSSSYNLALHVTVHGCESSYTCSKCNQIFSRLISLERHTQSFHSTTDD